MGIDWFRDLVICIFGLVGAGVFIFIAVIVYKLYCRVQAILNSAKTTSKKIQECTSYAGDEVVKPLIQVVATIQGVRQGIEAVSKFFKKQEGGLDNYK